MTADGFIHYRSMLLARVFLTRRSKTSLFSLDMFGLDMLCNPPHAGSFRPFGVVILGTDKEMSIEQAAKFAKKQKMPAQQSIFSFPVVVLLFSMQDDKGFLAWMTEPEEQSPRLFRRTDFVFQEITNKAIDDILDRIDRWYESLAAIILEK